MAGTSLLPAYLVVGSDELKRSHAVARMKKRLEASGLADFNLDERDMSKEQTPEEFCQHMDEAVEQYASDYFETE